MATSTGTAQTRPPIETLASVFDIQDTFDEVGRLRTVVTAVILLTMVVVGSKQPLND